MLTVSWSLQRAHHGEQPFWAALALAAMIGQIGLPGGGVGYGYGSLGGVGAPINVGSHPDLAAREENRQLHSVARISDMLLNPGAEYTYQGKVRTYPDARLVYRRRQPLPSPPGPEPPRRGVDATGNHHRQDPMFTATAQRADIVLPANTSIERNDIAGNKRSDFIIAMHKAIQPLGQSRSDFDIFNSIAGELGVGSPFNEDRDEMGRLRHLTKEAAAMRWIAWDTRCRILARSGSAAMALPSEDRHTYLASFRGSRRVRA